MAGNKSKGAKMSQYHAFVSVEDIKVATPKMLNEWKTLLVMDIEYFSHSMTGISTESQKRRHDVTVEMKTLVAKIDERLTK